MRRGDLQELRHFLRAVKDSSDSNFAIDGPAVKVWIATSASSILIRNAEPRSPGADITVPTSVVETLLSGAGDDLDLKAGFEALTRQGQGSDDDRRRSMFRLYDFLFYVDANSELAYGRISPLRTGGWTTISHEGRRRLGSAFNQETKTRA